MPLKKVYYYPIIFTIAFITILFAPLIQETKITTYTVWCEEGIVHSETVQTTRWISLYQFLLGDNKSIDKLKEALNKVNFKFQYRDLTCGEKSAIIMKYLKEKGFKVEMARGELDRGDQQFTHGWVLVHLKDGTYVVETNSQTGYPYVVGTTQEAAQGPLKYKEEERWSMEKVEKEYKELLKKPLTEYLEIEK
jgi:hypothetical protein